MSLLSFTSGPSTPTRPRAPSYIHSYSPPRPWYRPHFSLRAHILIALPLLSLLGGFGTWILGGANGTFKSIVTHVSQPGALLPGTNLDLITSYTGISALDHQLSILVTFFAPVTGHLDHDNGPLQLFSIFGMGQFGGVWCLMLMESLRMGNQGRKLVGFGFIGLVGMIFQNISYAVTVPLWLFIHLLTSPVSKPFPGTHANSVLLVPTWDLRVLPVSVTIGFIMPTVLMGLPFPDIVEPETHQYLVACWQAFPIWTVLIHYVLRVSAQFAAGKLISKDKSPRKQVHQGNSYLNDVKYIYGFVLGLCMVTHIPVLLISLLPGSIFPHSMPGLAYLSEDTFLTIYLPYFPSSMDYQIQSLVEGVHTFLIWDLAVGSLAFLLWAVLLYRNATSEKGIVDPNTSLPIYRELLLGERDTEHGQWKKLGTKIATWWVVSGPIGALTVLLWERDTIVRQKIKQGM